MRSFQAYNSRVVGFMYRRERGGAAPQPTWENIDLGVTVDRYYAKRVPKLAGAVMTVLKHRRLLKECSIWYARNIDMLLVATVARTLTRSNAVLVYEVLDIQRIFLGDGAVHRAMRWAERVLLKSCDLVVVSSQDFVDRYYVSQQGLTVPWRLLENKIADVSALQDHGREEHPALAAGPPWVIGWFGMLRCVRSLQILSRIAATLGDNVQITLGGRASAEDLPQEMIDATFASHANMSLVGAYRNPDDLPKLYGRVHFSWAVDYLDAGTNSDWLLPNRIYEGGLFGALALTRRDTAVARKVEREHLGWAFDEPLEQSVTDFLSRLTAETYGAMKEKVLQRNACTSSTKSIRAICSNIWTELPDDGPCDGTIASFECVWRAGCVAYEVASENGSMCDCGCGSHNRHGSGVLACRGGGARWHIFCRPVLEVRCREMDDLSRVVERRLPGVHLVEQERQVGDGGVTLSLTDEPFGERKFSCAEIRTKAAYGYGTYEVRMRGAAGAGVNSTFFTYVGPPFGEGLPHDEIDFEFLGKTQTACN